MEGVLEDDAVGAALRDRPGDPADEAVDRVARPWLGERELVAPAGELVRAVLDPVGPGHEHLAPSGARHLVGGVTVEQLAAPGRVGPEARADLDRDDALIAGRDLDLLAGWEDRGHPEQSLPRLPPEGERTGIRVRGRGSPRRSAPRRCWSAGSGS